jgi:hypothetical protein
MSHRATLFTDFKASVGSYNFEDSEKSIEKLTKKLSGGRMVHSSFMKTEKWPEGGFAGFVWMVMVYADNEQEMHTIENYFDKCCRLVCTGFKCEYTGVHCNVPWTKVASD